MTFLFLFTLFLSSSLYSSLKKKKNFLIEEEHSGKDTNPKYSIIFHRVSPLTFEHQKSTRIFLVALFLIVPR